MDSDSDHSTFDYEFDESQCLFCNQLSPDLDQNLVHMSKTHGLYINPTNLIVDVESLIAYFHLVISGYYECLYCGAQRNTREAVQQHMMAKGHCKYDITDEDSEFRDFYEFPSSDAKNELRQNLSTQLPSQLRPRKPRSPKPSKKQDSDRIASPPDQSQSTSTPIPESDTDIESHLNNPETPDSSQRELSIKAQKQAATFNNQLAHLRAGDRRSILHLPSSQQRAILATHHKQMEKSRRTEQTNRGNLERAGNHTNCLSKTRLIRVHPMMGNIFSLNR